MINLVNVSSKLQLTTSTTADIDVHVSYIDRSSTTGVVGAANNKNTAIVTATTTDICLAPAASTERNIKCITIRNKHASTSNSVAVKHTDGTTTVELFGEIITAGGELTWTEGAGWQISALPLRVSRTVITTLGASTYNVPTGVRAILVECTGGGGGGGGCLTAITNAAGAGGGGGGAYAAAMILNPAASYSVTVADGGAGGVAGANNGTVGADTTFNTSTVVAKGGSGGIADTVAAGPRMGGLGGAGGAASTSTGDIKSTGEPGGLGIALAAAQTASGAGGIAAGGLGGGASSGNKNSTGAGAAGTQFGGGGAGGSIISGGASQAGGKGAPGVIVITEYR
jgi:hypothetical protein